MKQSVRVLHLEDSPRDAELIQRKLKIGGLACEIVRVDSKEGFESALAKDVYDVILCDHNLPDYDGRSALALAQEKLPSVPVISLSGTLGEEEAVECLKHGATDYVLKHRLERLVPAMRRALREAEEHRARLSAEEESRASEAQFRAMFEVASIGMAQADPRTRQWLRVNQKMCAITGYSATELLGMRVTELTHSDDRQKDLEAFQRVVRGEAPDYRVEKRYVRKDGAVVWVNVNMTVIRDAAGQPTRTMATIEEITERKQLEEALRESSQLNQQIVASAQEGIIVYGRDLKYQVRNPFMEQLSGHPAREVLGKHPGELFPFLRDTGVLASIEKALAGEQGRAIDFPFEGRPSGKSGWASATSGPLRNGAGEIIGMIGIARDITERKRAELRVEAFSKLGLRLSAAKTAPEAAGTICETASELLGWDACSFSLYSPSKGLLDHVLEVDTIDGRRVECSPGYEPASVMARRAMETGGQLILKEKPGEMLPGGQPFGDSSRPSASIMFVPIRKGAEVIGVLSIQSYTPQAYNEQSLETLQSLADHCGGALDRVRMTQAWQTTQARLGHLLTQSPAVIYSLKTDGITTEPAWVSDNVERLLGYTVAECDGPEGLFSRLHPQDRQGVIDGLVQLFARRQIARDFRVRHKNGEYRWVRDEQRLVGDASGAPVEIVDSWVDITERKAIEEQLRQSQKMEAVGQLAGGVAHDFNNMLAVIRGNAELLLMTAGHLTADANESLTQVVNASERAATLTRQLLAFSRKQILQLQPLVLNEVIEHLTKMLKRIIGENIDLQCHYAARLPYVQADTSMMEQVILNLVVNARDAMQTGGLLRVATKETRRDEEQARTHLGARAGDFVCLMVGDTGTGIAPEVLPHIFEPFFTTKEVGKGTGLGLATVHGIVQQHQGWIEVVSQVGEGTTFKVFLPVIPTPERLEAPARVGGGVPGGTETILVVEDDHSVRQMTRRVLQSKGYKICEAASAQEALGLWDSHTGEIALLLTDIVMPGKMSGRDLADRLWAQSPGLRVIFMSGYSAVVMGKNTDSIQRARSRFLQKPCSARTILETVRQCLDKEDSTFVPAAADHPK
jgi:PAS domain S-box-containing protein